MDAFPSIGDMVVRTLVAVLGAAALGWERERRGKPAGLRTQMMVGLGSAVFTMVTLKFYQATIEAGEAGQVDPLRVVQGVIIGIGFLGAGTIVHARGSVKGLTTAATIWVVGAFGIACGLGYYFLAGVSVFFALIVLIAMGLLERRLIKQEEAENQREPIEADGSRPTA